MIDITSAMKKEVGEEGLPIKASLYIEEGGAISHQPGGEGGVADV